MSDTVSMYCKINIFLDSTCILRTTVIAEYFDHQAYTGELVDRGLCYSGWKFRNNITPKIVSMTASSIYDINHVPKYSVMGLYLYQPQKIFSSSAGDATPFIIYEFDQIRTLEKIIFKIRHMYYDGFEDNIYEISEDGIDYTPFAAFESNFSANKGDIVELIGEPKSMKFVRISRQSYWLVLAEIVFIGH